jgi:hypothetical protein
MKLVLTHIVLVSSGYLAFGLNASAQTFTAIMSGENSEAFSFISSASRSTVTSIQSPFGYPNATSCTSDTQTYPTGNSSSTPPYWFYYTLSSGVYTANDATGLHPCRQPSYGQTSFLKSAVIGIRPKAAFSGTASSSGASGTMLETVYFSERADWAGQREFGFYRQMTPGATPSFDKLYFYWSTNSNCSTGDNSGYPWCRTSQATNSTETPSIPPLVPEYFTTTEMTGLTAGTTYYFTAYLFWAGWDSTYKFRVEAWDSTHTTEISATNVDTSSGGVNYGATTSGMNGYVTAGTQRIDPDNHLSSSGVQLSVTSIEIVQ